MQRLARRTELEPSAERTETGGAERSGRRVRCPACKVTPWRGNLWQCDACGEVFDTFTTQAQCPACSKRFPTTQCPTCWERNPIADWLVAGADHGDGNGESNDKSSDGGRQP